ncbi:MAG: DUF2460 domain-containing protein [Desulfobacteraceae bacterium]|nr:DUF2460 domain-containing protein [Desulfobacteraceae bacterium]
MSGFLDIRFPINISYGSSGGPGYNTSIIEVMSGKEKRNSNWDYPRCEYNAAYGVRQMADVEALIEIFHIAKGRGYSFRYKDFFDFKSCRLADTPSNMDQIIATADGSAEFQIYKTYQKTSISGAIIYSQVRKITKIVENTFLLALDTVEQSSGFTLDETTGIITFDTQDLDIVAVDIAADWIKVAGDKTSDISVADSIEIQESTGNDGVKTVSGVTYISGDNQTQIDVSEDIADSTVDGKIVYGQPNAGVSITAGYEFDVHVRFDTDQISASLDDYKSGSIDVPVIEEK